MATIANVRECEYCAGAVACFIEDVICVNRICARIGGEVLGFSMAVKEVNKMEMRFEVSVPDDTKIDFADEIQKELQKLMEEYVIVSKARKP